jgi:K+-transporting ATPase KdpF subunit
LTGSGCILDTGGGICGWRRQDKFGEATMAWEWLAAGVCSVVLLAYLTFTLLYPERF